MLHFSNVVSCVSLCCGIQTCVIDRWRAHTSLHLSYKDRWADAGPDQQPRLSPAEATVSYSPAAVVPFPPLHHKLQLLTCPLYKPKNQWGLFVSLRLLKTNQCEPIYCNKDESALDKGMEMLWTSVIRFSNEGEIGSADRTRAFVFIEWLLCEASSCLVSPQSLPAGAELLLVRCYSQQRCSSSSGWGLTPLEVFPTDWRLQILMRFPP